MKNSMYAAVETDESLEFRFKSSMMTLDPDSRNTLAKSQRKFSKHMSSDSLRSDESYYAERASDC